jgi:hypothetical protein
MEPLCIIIPCAGKGTRLNLPFSKELFSFEKGKCLIDYTFDMFSNYKRHEVNFVVTIDEDKTDLVKYLGKYKHLYNISFTYFNPCEVDLPGSLRSAKHLFGENNIVVLPDTIMKFKYRDIVDTINKELLENDFIFLFKKETLHRILMLRGALYVSNTNHIIDYEDKPQKGIDRFNAYWCSFAFKKDAFDSYMNVIEKFYKKENNKPLIKSTLLYNTKAIEIEDYADFGTWDEIYNKFKSH